MIFSGGSLVHESELRWDMSELVFISLELMVVMIALLEVAHVGLRELLQ